MRIVSIIPKSELPSVDPLFVFDVSLAFQHGQRMPLDLSILVSTEDKKILGVARSAISVCPQNLSLSANELGANSGEVQVVAQAMMPLSPKQVDYIEGLRSKHRKGDVVLECRVEVQFLVSKTVNAYLHVVEEKPAPTGQPVVYRQHSSRDPFGSHFSNMWVLSGDNGRVFMERETLRHSSAVTIHSSDWLHDYAAPWRSTRYVVVELPQPELLVAPVTPAIADRVNAAIEAAKRAADNVSKGEWNDVVEDLRPVWELLRNQADITSLLNRDGYPQDAIAALNASIQQQFTLASKFMHRLDQSGQRINPEIRAAKEDAWLCYSFAMTLLNLVARKATRLS